MCVHVCVCVVDFVCFVFVAHVQCISSIRFRASEREVEAWGLWVQSLSVQGDGILRVRPSGRGLETKLRDV